MRIYTKNLQKVVKKSGFALPTVLIASIVMLGVLSFVAASSSTVRTNLDEQYYNQLAQTAADAGIEYAKACLAANNNVPQWGGKQLKPDTNCLGDIIGADSFLLSNGNIKTTFSVDYPEIVNGKANGLTVKGSTTLLRTSNGTEWKSYGQVSRMNYFSETKKLIVSGDSHNCAIAFNDKVYCWGNNKYGQLGTSTNDGRCRTTIDTDGTSTAYCWSPQILNYGGITPGAKIIDIAIGSYNTCVLTDEASGNAYCWGLNNYGQLGNGDTTNRPTPIKVSGFDNARIISISIGEQHTCALVSSDTMVGSSNAYCWGLNNYGQLGNNPIADNGNIFQSQPPYTYNKLVPTLVSSNIIFSSIMAGGWGHSCAITSVGKIYCWGNNDFGQIGRDGGSNALSRSIPTEISGGGIFSSLSKVNGSVQYNCALGTDKKIYCWGHNGYGQLGSAINASPNEWTSFRYQYGLNQALSDKSIISVAEGGYHACALDDKGKVYCWGGVPIPARWYKVYVGQLGSNNIDNGSVSAIEVQDLLLNKDIKSISSGDYHSCSVDSDSKVYCWGDNKYGQLGVDPSTKSISKIPVETYKPSITEYNF